jgi:hypothetical protein
VTGLLPECSRRRSRQMTITTSSVLTESSSGAFLRPPHRLRGHPGCGRWLTGITRTERLRTDMRQHGRRPCRHSLGAGTERRDQGVRSKKKPRRTTGLNCLSPNDNPRPSRWCEAPAWAGGLHSVRLCGRRGFRSGTNSERGDWFHKRKAPPSGGAGLSADCGAGIHGAHPFTFAGQHVRIGAAAPHSRVPFSQHCLKACCRPAAARHGCAVRA